MAATKHADEHGFSPIGGANDRRLLKRMLVFAKPHVGALLTAVALLVAGLGLRLAGPWIIKQVIDGPISDAARARAEGAELDTAALTEQVTHWGLALLGVAATTAALLVFREWLMNRTGQRIVLSVRDTLFHHTLRLPSGWFDKHHVGWTVTRSTSDVDALSELFTTGVATIAYDILTIIVVVSVLLFISPSLALVAILILPIMIAVSFRFRLNARIAYRATRKSLSALNGFLQERLTGLDVVHLFRREKASGARFGGLNDTYYRDNMVTVKHFSLFFPTVDSLSWTVKTGTLVWGAWLLSQGSLSLGDWVMFWLLLDFVFEPIRELAERYNVLQAAMAAGERIFSILDAEAETGAAELSATIAAAGRSDGAREVSGAGAEHDHSLSLVRIDETARASAAAKASAQPVLVGAGASGGSPAVTTRPAPAGDADPEDTVASVTAGATSAVATLEPPQADDPASLAPPAPAPPAEGVAAIAFEHVRFGYGDGPTVLDDVSFRVEPGQRVAVVGHTGAGKTTLVSLLLRFYEAQHGAIRLFGDDVRELDHQELRRRIAIVQQDVFLFSDTIGANIRMGDPTLTDERVRAIAAAVNADRFVDKLPDGYETRLRERGSNLSSSQRQLLAFARALAANPEVLILDEATSSVDSETEAWIEQATATLLEGRTSLVIAHRLSTVVSCDQILVMHKGKLHEQGTHDELLAARGLYHKLYHLHLAGGAG